jgi:glucokinase
MIKLGIVEDGKVRQFRLVPAPASGSFLGCLDALAEEVQDLAGPLGEVAGWGISFPGIVDPYRRRVLATAGKYPDAQGADLTGWSRSRSVAVVLENDANAALIGETTTGCAPGETDAVLCILGTGIGTAVRMGGQVLRGAHFQAGILGGHFKTGGTHLRCSCGGRGCWEAQASTWALPALAQCHSRARGLPLPQASWTGFQALFEDWRRGHPLAKSLVETLVDRWAQGVATLIHAYDPSTVILTGGILESRDGFLDSLVDRVRASVWTPWGFPVFRVPPQPRASVLLGLDVLLKETLG